MEHDMTTPQPSFGQALAFAEQTLTEVLRRHLEERNTTPQTWYALQLIGTRGPGLAREALTRDLENSRTLTPESTRELLARLEGEGLIRGDAAIDLTTEGQALFQSLREYIAGPTARLLGQFDRADIDTTIRTLQAVTRKAAEELAVP
jgi:DNA-binding MarR family transcriptional regulator